MAGGKSRSERISAGAAWLEQNRARPGVVVTPSGLQYEVLRPGSGAPPKPRDTVKVHYLGTLPDGTPFDSSYERREPAVFPVNAVIAGWVEGLKLMSPGAKFRFVIPPDLAYGEEGAGDDIGPDAVLVFEVELLEILQA